MPRGAGRPKGFKKPTVASFLKQTIDSRAEIVLNELEDALEQVRREKGNREARMVLDMFRASSVDELKVAHYSTFLRVCRDKSRS